MAEKTQKIGLITTTSLVVGNMIGVGIFVIPAALAKYGSISLLGWVFTAAGSLVLAKIFSNFSKIIVNKSGGPYAYSRAGFGDFIGFLVAWGYWICIWIGNGAIAIGVVGALSFFFPVLETNSFYQLAVGLGIIWIFTWIRLFYFKLDNFPAFNLTSDSNFVTFPAVAVITLYAFLGLECASVPAADVRNPEVTVPRATMIGTILTTIVYILSTVVLFGILPNDMLQSSPKPFADAAQLIAGDFGGYFVAIGVIISGLGVMNGWVLMVSQVPMATAKDELFPRIFKRENKKGAPIFGLLIGSALTSMMLLISFGGGLVDQFEFIVEISVFAALVPFLFTAAAYIIILIDKKLHNNNWVKTFVLGSLGFAYSLWAIWGSGRDTTFYGFMLLLSGIPFYLLMRWHKRNE